jgi:hypothetical protein
MLGRVDIAVTASEIACRQNMEKNVGCVLGESNRPGGTHYRHEPSITNQLTISTDISRML